MSRVFVVSHVKTVQVVRKLLAASTDVLLDANRAHAALLADWGHGDTEHQNFLASATADELVGWLLTELK